MLTLKGTMIGNIYHLELSRPKALNAMSIQYFADMHKVIEEINSNLNIRVVVLTAQGKHFCVGLDLKDASNMLQVTDDMDQARKSIRFYDMLKYQQKALQLDRIRVPVIVGVHGYCLGGGIDLISSADIRYCSEDALFSIKEVDIATAADFGTIQRMGRQNSNTSLFRELLNTGRMFNAKEALDFGLVSRIVKKEQLESELFKLAEIIASKSPAAIYTIKSILNRENNVEDDLDVIARTNMALFFTNDLNESIAKFASKSLPAYPKL